MKIHVLEKRKGEALSNGIFLFGMGILFITERWWPGILLVLFGALALRQYFSGRIFDLITTSGILLGLFIISLFNISIQILMPLLILFSGIYLTFREYFYGHEELSLSSEDANG